MNVYTEKKKHCPFVIGYISQQFYLLTLFTTRHFPATADGATMTEGTKFI